MLPLYIYDPTSQDSLSRVRGVGRYLQILRENLNKEAHFTNNLKKVPFESVLVNPFFNVLGKPLITGRIAEKQIAVIHDVIPLLYPAHFQTGIRAKFNLYLNQLTIKNYDRIITDSKKSRDNIVDVLGVEKSKITVLYATAPAIFSDNINSTKKSGLKDLKSMPSEYFLYVGDVTWNKNIVKLAKAAKIADVNVVFVGKSFKRRAGEDHWDKEFKAFQSEVQDNSRFIFPGYVSDEELVGLYKNAMCTVLISRDEGFGFPYLEASTLSCPSVLSDIPVFKEVAGDAALYADPVSIQSITQTLQKISESLGLRKELGRKAYERSKKFSQGVFKSQFMEAVH